MDFRSVFIEMLEALKSLAHQEDWEGEDIHPDSPLGKAYSVIDKAKRILGMVHNERRFCVKGFVQVEELAALFHDRTWTLCTGFQIGKYLWLNDAFREDGSQEYAVLIPSNAEKNTQIESITVSWCSIERLTEFINQCLSGAWDENRYGEHTIRIDGIEEHGRCPLCA